MSVRPGGTVVFPATVDFSPTHVLVPGSPSPFPPSSFQAGAVGEAG